jgi:hypothetical protein
MKMRELFPSKYLRSADLDGETRIVVVDHVEYDDLTNNGRTEKKAVLHFQGSGTKPFVCNKTNSLVMVELSGSDDADDWAGTRIALSPTMVPFKGKPTQSIRVGYAPKEDKMIFTGKSKVKTKNGDRHPLDDNIDI